VSAAHRTVVIICPVSLLNFSFWLLNFHYYSAVFSDILCSVVHKKTCHFYFYDNFYQCGSILFLFTLAFTEELWKSHNKTYHLAFNLFPHYLEKFEYQLYNFAVKLFNLEVMQNCLFTVTLLIHITICIIDVKYSFMSKQINLHFYSVFSKCPLATHTHGLNSACHGWRQQCIFQCCVRCSRHCHTIFQSCKVTLAALVEINKLKINLSDRNTSQFVILKRN